MHAEIIDFKKSAGGYEIIVRVEIFVGAHNPPYGLETITLIQDHKGITIKEFQHKEL